MQYPVSSSSGGGGGSSGSSSSGGGGGGGSSGSSSGGGSGSSNISKFNYNIYFYIRPCQCLANTGTDPQVSMLMK